MDEYESDEWDSERGHAKLVRYSRDQQRHGQLSRDIERTHREWQAMDDVKPVNPRTFRDTPQDAMRRWFARGLDGLEAGEQEIFLVKPDEDRVADNPLLVASKYGDVFDPAGMISGHPSYAAGDPVRSDLDTGDDSALGLAAPEEWARDVVEALKYFGSVAGKLPQFRHRQR